MRVYRVTSEDYSEKKTNFIFKNINRTIALKSGLNRASKEGIKFTSEMAVKYLGLIKTIAVEKDGILTKGNPIVTDIFPADDITRSGYKLDDYSEEILLGCAYILSKECDHPFAKAINAYTANVLSDPDDEIQDVRYEPGVGIQGTFQSLPIRGGSLSFVEEIAIVSPEIKQRAEELKNLGRTPIFFSKGKKLLGIIALSDNYIKESREAVNKLNDLGIQVLSLSNENRDSLMKKALSDEKEVLLINNNDDTDFILETDSLSKVLNAIIIARDATKKFKN